MRKRKDMDPTAHKTENRCKRNPTGKPRWALQQQKHRAPTISSIDKSLIGTVIESEVRSIDVQLKRKAKLPTVIGLTTKYAVCCNTLMLYEVENIDFYIRHCMPSSQLVTRYLEISRMRLFFLWTLHFPIFMINCHRLKQQYPIYLFIRYYLFFWGQNYISW